MRTEDIVKEIITEQSLIIGENLAKQTALSSGAIRFNSAKLDDFTLTETSSEKVIEKLINSYKNIFGQASVEVCMGVIRKFPSEQVGSFLPKQLNI